MALKDRLKALRIEQGLTLADLAAKTGVTLSHLSRVEAGERNLRLPKIYALAKALGVEPKELTGEEALVFSPDLAPYKPPRGSAMEKAFTSTTQRIYKVLSNCMEELGITLGDPIIVDVSPEAIKNLTNGQLVVVEIPGKRGEETTLLLRQYISPNLLITNSITENSTPIHRVAAKAVIIGIVMQ